MAARLKVLVVEDEALVAMLVEDAVETAGHSVAFSASNIMTAMAAAASEDIDVALLDLNLNGQKAHAVALALADRGKPFAFITGYGDRGVLDTFADAPVISKPFTMQEVTDVLRILQSRIEDTGRAAADLRRPA